MGFDPTRKHRRTRFDYWFVAIALLVFGGLILWGLLGFLVLGDVGGPVFGGLILWARRPTR